MTITAGAGFGSGRRRRRGSPRGALAAAFAALITYCALFAPGSATEARAAGGSGAAVLEATNHAELRAAVSAAGVIRIAFVGDRIARVVRGSRDLQVEHDPARGDLYLRALPGGSAAASGAQTGTPFAAVQRAEPGASPGEGPAVLFLGTEKGFTYRLALVPVPGGPAQILIRNPDAAASVTAGLSAGDARVGALVRLVGAAVRRAPPAGYAVEAGASEDGFIGDAGDAVRVAEIWRGRRLTALVLRLGPEVRDDAAALGQRLGPDIAAAWVSPRGTPAPGGRLAVAVRGNAPAGVSR